MARSRSLDVILVVGSHGGDWLGGGTPPPPGVLCGGVAIALRVEAGRPLQRPGQMSREERQHLGQMGTEWAGLGSVPNTAGAGVKDWMMG